MKGLTGVMMVGGVAVALLLLFTGSAVTQQTAVYVGSQACGECHETEYEHFSKFAKKATSYESIEVMRKGLTEAELKECFVCHTTGYGKPGGFVSKEKTPELANAGCEVCHGPGSEHVEAGGDPSLINHDLSLADCEACHNAERVSSFDFKPLLYGGAH